MTTGVSRPHRTRLTRPRPGHPLTVTPTLDGLPWALVLTSMVVAAAGCGGSAPSRAVGANTPVSQPMTVASRAPSDGEELRNLLIARAAALPTCDAAKLTGTSTGRRQRARDRRMAAAAKRMPLDGVEMTLRSTDITADRAVLRVVPSYGFDNVESRFFNRSRVTAVKTPQGWRVRSERAPGAQAPWELGRYVARSSPHFLALAPRGLRVGGLMQDLEA